MLLNPRIVPLKPESDQTFFMEVRKSISNIAPGHFKLLCNLVSVRSGILADELIDLIFSNAMLLHFSFISGITIKRFKSVYKKFSVWSETKIYINTTYVVFMDRQITELEKTILISTLVLVRGNTRKFIKEDDIVLKFPMRQRKTVRRFFKRLVDDGYVIKSPAGDSFRLLPEGLKIASRLLYEGATFV